MAGVASSQIELVSPNGRHRRPLTRHPSENTDPAWAPDGRRLAFVRVLPQAHRSPYLYSVGADGTGLRLLAAPSAEEPVWSPNGRRIAFVRGGAIGGMASVRPRLWVMNRDGTRKRLLGTIGPFDGKAAWAPDGHALAIADFRRHEADADIYLVRIDGSPRRRIVGTRWIETHPDWSTTGRLAWKSWRGFRAAIWTANVDGSARRRVFLGAGVSAPVWSPDGSRLAFAAQGRIYVAGAGSVARPITARLDARQPVWSRDGRMIAFTRAPERKFNSDVLVVNAEGGRARAVARSTPAAERAWTWQPR